MATFYTGVDKERYDAGNKFLPMDQFLLNYTAPKTNVEEVTTSYGIPSTNAFTYSGGDQNYYPGKTSNLIGDFNRATTEREARINEANRPLRPAQFPAFPQAKTPGGLPANAMYNMATKDINNAFNRSGMSSTFPTRTAKEMQDYANEALLSHQEKARTGQFGPSYIEEEKPTLKRRLNDFAYDHIPGINRSQSYEDIMEKGYREPGGVMPGIIGLMNKLGIQNFASLPQADQAFITSQKGYTGPTVFGDQGNMGHSVDPFGKNVESLFGNYAEGVQKDYTKLSDLFSATGKGSLQEKYGVTWDEDEGIFKGANAKKAMDKTKMLRTRLNFRKNQMNEQKNIEADLAARHQKERDFASGDVDTSQQAAADQARIDRAYREDTGGDAGSYAPGGGSGAHAADASGSTYSDPFDPGGGEKDGGFIDGSNRRVPFFYGGLLSIL